MPVQGEIASDTPTPQAGLGASLRRLGGVNGSSRAIRIAIKAGLVLAVLAAVTVLYYALPAEGARESVFEFSREWSVGWDVGKWISNTVDWFLINWDPLFTGIREAVLWILLPFRDFLQWLPWWLVIAGTVIAAWRAVSMRFGLIAGVFLGVLTILGLFDLAMLTLAITLTATLLCVVIGVPLGIAAGTSDRFDSFTRPILDGMQTMPSFVYLIPAVMAFKMGMTPAIMATIIYAVPPIIRLTNLGIRQVDAQVMEAAQSFGTTKRQLLVKVQMPLAMPTILAGLNQTVMMALAMVVIASMIGAQGLGVEVLNGINRLEIGRGFLGGLGIVILAIILDRISQGLAKRPEVRAAA